MDQRGIRAAELVLGMAHSAELEFIDEVLFILASGGRRHGAAAALATTRDRSPRSPIERAALAADVLRAAYEEHEELARRPPRFFEASNGAESGYKQVEREPDDRQRAQFYTALAALALAIVYRRLGEPAHQAAWLHRSRAPFLHSYRMFPPLVESRMTLASTFVRREPTRADIADYRRRCDRLLAAYQSAYQRLGG
ncbi:MAG TPA: hypothetical protein VKB69_07160 [Micromonosporaceae bacterium]|nr:hypothetical protein [Micromonosporaceae bacterium]